MQEINLYDLIKHYASNWLLIVSLTLLGAIAGGIYTGYIQTPMYKSESTLLLVSVEGERVTTDPNLINNYVELLKSRSVLQPIINDQELDINYDDLVRNVEVTNERDSEVIKVAITSPNREQSTAILEEAVTSLQTEVENIYKEDNVRIVDEASLPNEPYNVNPELQIALGSIAGLMTAIILLFFVYDYKLANGDKTGVKREKKQTFRKILISLLTGHSDINSEAVNKFNNRRKD